MDDGRHGRSIARGGERALVAVPAEVLDERPETPRVADGATESDHRESVSRIVLYVSGSYDRLVTHFYRRLPLRPVEAVAARAVGRRETGAEGSTLNGTPDDRSGMEVLVPIDGSDPSFRALEFAAEFARRFEADLHVVHITDVATDATEEITDRAREVLAAEGIEATPEVSTDLELSSRPSSKIGRDILDLVEERGYDHVVMGHHDSGAVERVILGSTAQTVIQNDEVPVTVVS
jgi:nucleotide-binding universal stress UspA family protein